MDVSDYQLYLICKVYKTSFDTLTNEQKITLLRGLIKRPSIKYLIGLSHQALSIQNCLYYAKKIGMVIPQQLRHAKAAFDYILENLLDYEMHIVHQQPELNLVDIYQCNDIKSFIQRYSDEQLIALNRCYSEEDVIWTCRSQLIDITVDKLKERGWFYLDCQKYSIYSAEERLIIYVDKNNHTVFSCNELYGCGIDDKMALTVDGKTLFDDYSLITLRTNLAKIFQINVDYTEEVESLPLYKLLMKIDKHLSNYKLIPLSNYFKTYSIPLQK